MFISPPRLKPAPALADLIPAALRRPAARSSVIPRRIVHRRGEQCANGDTGDQGQARGAHVYERHRAASPGEGGARPTSSPPRQASLMQALTSRPSALPASAMSSRMPSTPGTLTARNSDLRVHGHRHQAVGHAGLQHIAAYFARLSTFVSRESSAATSTWRSSFVMDWLLPGDRSPVTWRPQPAETSQSVDSTVAPHHAPLRWKLVHTRPRRGGRYGANTGADPAAGRDGRHLKDSPSPARFARGGLSYCLQRG